MPDFIEKFRLKVMEGEITNNKAYGETVNCQKE